MKLKLKADYLETLHEWRQDVENDIRRPCSWREIFEPDNAMTFADLEVGQVFQPKEYHSLETSYWVKTSSTHFYYSGQDGHLIAWSDRAWVRDEVIPGKIIDGKFVPDREGE